LIVDRFGYSSAPGPLPVSNNRNRDTSALSMRPLNVVINKTSVISLKLKHPEQLAALELERYILTGVMGGWNGKLDSAITGETGYCWCNYFAYKFERL